MSPSFHSGRQLTQIFSENDETEFNVLTSNFMREQYDGYGLAFGDLNKQSISLEVVRQCSEAVLGQLDQVFARVTQCMPWLNATALVQIWAEACW